MGAPLLLHFTFRVLHFAVKTRAPTAKQQSSKQQNVELKSQILLLYALVFDIFRLGPRHQTAKQSLTSFQPAVGRTMPRLEDFSKRHSLKATSLLLATSMFVLGCESGKEPNQENLITIVDIGTKDRIELGKLLRIINENAPRVVGLDFLLVPDSLDKDTILVKELLRAKRSVQVVSLHDYDSSSNRWDSLEVSNAKFEVSSHGFSNVMTTDDSVLVKELPLWQYHRGMLVPSFSYAVANSYAGVKPEYRKRSTEEKLFPFLRLVDGYKLIKNEDLMSGKFQRSDFEDKIVLMGFIGYGDDFYMHRDHVWKVNGVAIHAAIINEILERRTE